MRLPAVPAAALSVLLLFVASADAEAGPGNEEPGQELEVDEAYRAHVSSIMSAIQEGEGKSDVKYTDLKPQMVNIHTIAPRIPALKVGMNALGHKMLHVHSDEPDAWSAEIMSSGATAGFSLTDRVKGLQKGDGKPGTQWTMYSAAKVFRVQDVAAGDVLQVQDGTMTLQGNKGTSAKKPRFTIMGGADSVPRVTLVSKTGDATKHVSLYNRYGKFGVFAGMTDESIFHVSADGSELALTSVNSQPKVLIQSKNKGKSQQELILKGADHSLKLFHKGGQMGFCKPSADGKKCASFFSAPSDGSQFDFKSQTDSAKLTVSHKIRGKNSELELISQDQVGDLTSTTLFNAEGTVGFRIKNKVGSKVVLTIDPAAKATFSGKVEVRDTANFKKQVDFAHNVNVAGVVTMQGKNVVSLFTDMEATKRENMELRRRLEDMEDDSKELKSRMVEMQQTNMAMKQSMESMMSSMKMMQETMTTQA